MGSIFWRSGKYFELSWEVLISIQSKYLTVTCLNCMSNGFDVSDSRLFVHCRARYPCHHPTVCPIHLTHR